MDKKPVTGVQNPTTDETMRTPAFIANNPELTTLNSTSEAGLSIFTNPVTGNVGAASHTGDLGGAA